MGFYLALSLQMQTISAKSRFLTFPSGLISICKASFSKFFTFYVALGSLYLNFMQFRTIWNLIWDIYQHKRIFQTFSLYLKRLNSSAKIFCAKSKEFGCNFEQLWNILGYFWVSSELLQLSLLESNLEPTFNMFKPTNQKAINYQSPKWQKDFRWHKYCSAWLTFSGL